MEKTRNGVRPEILQEREKRKSLDNSISAMMSMGRLDVNTSATLRREVLQRLLLPNRDYNFECGYPDTISTDDYKSMYDREGVGTRVVQVYPEECWSIPPKVYETESAEEKTEFEKAFDVLVEEKLLLHFLQRIDVLSGIGTFGVLLIGLNDGEVDLSKPVPGINEKTGEGEQGSQKRELLYLRAFDQSLVEVTKSEGDASSPRFGSPIEYEIKFVGNSKSVVGVVSQNRKVHWTRILHVADNRESSEVYGIPRMQRVFNRLFDIKKVAAGSGEMFWKGGFPGYAFEVNPDLTDVTMDADSVKTEMRKYSDGLQRYIAIEGVTVKSLAPQVADPAPHIMTGIKLIAVSMGVPYRVFLGTEEAQLAGAQDIKSWNSRLAKRQRSYVTPMLVRPAVDRLIVMGILPEPEEYTVQWEDLNAPSDEDTAKIAKDLTEAMAKYVGGGVDALIPPQEYLVKVLGYTEEEAETIVAAAEEREEGRDLDREADLERRESEVALREQRGLREDAGAPADG